MTAFHPAQNCPQTFSFSGLNMICKRMNCKKESPILCNCSQASNWLEGSRTAPELPPSSLSLDYSSNFFFLFQILEFYRTAFEVPYPSLSLGSSSNFQFFKILKYLNLQFSWSLLNYHPPFSFWTPIQFFDIGIFNFLGPLPKYHLPLSFLKLIYFPILNS